MADNQHKPIRKKRKYTPHPARTFEEWQMRRIRGRVLARVKAWQKGILIPGRKVNIKPYLREFLAPLRAAKQKAMYLAKRASMTAEQRAAEAAKTRAYQKANPEKCMALRKKWRTANPEKQRLIRLNSARKRRSTAKGRLNQSFRKAIKNSVNGRGKTGCLKSRLGYTMHDLRAHLERQFLPGMSWGNRCEWHVDHIIPLAAFKFETADDPEFRAAWALSNLRPMWAMDNIKKGSKRTLLL